MPPPYIFDASIWVRIVRTHPLDIYRRFWAQLDAAISSGHVVSPEEILIEIARGTDQLDQALRQRPGLFVPPEPPLQRAVDQVMGRCRGLYDGVGERDRGDPWVVALGSLLTGTVVTGERPRRMPTAPMKIPDACGEMGVTWLPWFDFLREVAWDL